VKEAAHTKRVFCTSDFIALFSLTISATLEYLFPSYLPLVNRTAVLLLGAVLTALAVVFIFAAKVQFRNSKQKTGPGHPIHELITSGVYRYSRNPIYFGVVLILISIGLFFESLWVIAGAFFAGALIHFILIKPEEKYLGEKFGDVYRRYTSRAKRWW